MKINSINNYQTFKGKPPVLETKAQLAKYIHRRREIINTSKTLERSGLIMAAGGMATGAIAITAKMGDFVIASYAMMAGALGSEISSLGCLLHSIKMSKIAKEAKTEIKIAERQKIADEELKLFRLSKKSHKSHSRAISRRLKLENKMNEG